MCSGSSDPVYMVHYLESLGMEIGSFLLYLQNVKRYSPLTLAAYKEDLVQFVEFCDKIEMIHDWAEVTLHVVRRFEVAMLSGNLYVLLRRTSKSKPMAASSVRRKMSSLRTFFRYQVREGFLSIDPTENIVLPKMKKRLPVFVPDYDMDHLIDSGKIGKNDFAFSRDLMFLMMAYHTGMRRSELIGLKLEDLDLAAGIVRITGKGNKQRILPLLDELKKEIQVYLLEREKRVVNNHTYFFITDAGKPANEKYIYRHVKKCLEQIDSIAKRSPHVLRHSFATVLLNNGACSEAIRKLLGHSSLAATQVYTHNSFENLKRCYNQAHPRA